MGGRDTPVTTKVRIIGSGDGKVVADLTLDQIATNPVVDSSLHRLYLLHLSDPSTQGQEVAIDLHTGAQARTQPIGFNPVAQAFDPAGGRLFVVADNGGPNAPGMLTILPRALLDYPAGTLQLSQPPIAVAADPTNGHTFVLTAWQGSNPTAAAGNVIMLDSKTGAVLHAVSVGTEPFWLAVAPRLGRAYVLDRGSTGVTSVPPTLTILDAGTGAVQATIVI
jgi:DNA-binding beta-propeller fold protein YncE